MTYQEFIQNIIDTRGQWNIQENEYYEKHHIIPRCLGGSDINENIIWLYAREHFIAHKLLFLENPANIKLAFAYSMMAFVKSDNQSRYELSPEEYEEIKIINSINRKKFFANISDEDKEKFSKKISDIQQNMTDEEKEQKVKKIKFYWENKSDEDRALYSRKCSDRMLNRTDKENISTREKQQDAWNNKTQEELSKINNKRKKSLDERTDEEKLAAKNKWKESYNGRSEEEKLATSVKHSLSIKSTIDNMDKDKRTIWNNKNSIAHKGGKNPAAIKVRCITTDEIFNCIKEAVDKYHVDVGRLSKSHKPDKNGNVWERL